jgi:hypothetical protein
MSEETPRGDSSPISTRIILTGVVTALQTAHELGTAVRVVIHSDWFSTVYSRNLL